MAKGYTWAPSNKPGKPSEAEKEQVVEAFLPVIEKMKAQIPPLEEPQRFNQCVDIQTYWRRGYYYVMGQYKCPPTPEYLKEGFTSGIARLTYLRTDAYALAYFRHTGKWKVTFPELSLNEAVETVKNGYFIGL
jgi:hypothetical protein